MRMRTGLILLAAALTMSAVTAAPAQAVGPKPITACGQVLPSGSYYLARDLTCAAGFTLRPGVGTPEDPAAANVTVDLRGHRLKGKGTGSAFSGGSSCCYANLTVRNGRIDNWQNGIRVSGSATVTKVTLSNNAQAMSCDGVGCTVIDSALINNKLGITIWEASVDVQRSVISGSDVGARIYWNVDSGTFSNSTFIGNKVGIAFDGQLNSMDAHHNVFAANGTGIAAPNLGEGEDYRRATISDNAFLGNTNGLKITISGPDSAVTVARNLAVRNKFYGLYSPGVIDGGGNKAAGNGKPCVGVACTRP